MDMISKRIILKKQRLKYHRWKKMLLSEIFAILLKQMSMFREKLTKSTPNSQGAAVDLYQPVEDKQLKSMGVKVINFKFAPISSLEKETSDASDVNKEKEDGHGRYHR